MNPTERYDLAVVGGGIVGAMVSHYASQLNPKAHHILIDRYKFGAGATLLSAGLMPVLGSSHAALALARRSRALYTELLAPMDQAAVRPQPAYWIYPRDREAELFAGLGRSLEEGEARSELAKHHPSLVLPAGYKLARDDSVWAANGEATARLLLDQKPAHRVLIEGVHVEGIEEDIGGFVVHRGDGVATHAKRVVVAPGPWILQGPSAQWAREQGLRLKRTACLHLSGDVAPQAPALIFYAERAFVLPLPALQRTLLSYTADDWDMAPLRGELSISATDRVVALSILTRFSPARAADYSGGQVFCDAYTPEQVPRVATLGGRPGYVVVGGCSGSGMRLAPGLAEQALALAWR